jgi:hypothetical protein
MHLEGDRNHQFDYSLNHVKLDKTTLERDLGVWMSDDLASSVHISKAVSKANQILGSISRTFTYLNCKLMKQLPTLYCTCKTSSRIWKRGVAFLSEDRSKSVRGSATQSHQNGARLSRVSI